MPVPGLFNGRLSVTGTLGNHTLTDNKFSELGLAEPILRALQARNHSQPTPIQAQAIPALLAGRDVLGIAQTGTGKTGAFALPILQQLSSRPSHAKGRGPRALILAPTRELAIQIGEEIRAYGKRLPVRHSVIFGGVGQRPQVDALVRGLDILVATPGRLLDLVEQGHVRLNGISHLVLDEADRMLDMGFVRDVRKIVAALPKARQSLLFSATMPKEVARLSGEILHNPQRVEVTPQSTPVERIEQSVFHVPAGGKLGLLADVLADPSLSRVIVFSRTKHRANRIAEQLEKRGITADAIHGNKSQSARQRALGRFRAGQIRVLVATDIAARGIDIEGVTHVVNFELPNEPESYVHRIGRTARAGAAGAALSFCDPGERDYLRDIQRLIGRQLTVVGEVPAGDKNQQTVQGAGPGADGRGRPKGKISTGKPRNKRRRARNGRSGEAGRRNQSSIPAASARARDAA